MTTQGSDLSDFAAWIGLDWADRKHDVCLQCAGQRRREMSSIEHSVEAIDAWVCTLRERFAGRPVAVALELEHGPIVSALRKYDFIVLFPSAQMRALEQLVEMRRRLVDDRTRITNRLTSALKNYFPQVLQWFEDKGGLLFCDFLQRWPTLKAAQQARRSTLERFFHEHNVRYPARIEQRIDSIKHAIPLTDDPGVIEPGSLFVKSLVEQLRTTIQAIDSFDREIAARAPAHPDFRIFDSLPAAGPTLAPRLLTAFGEQGERYPRAADLQRYAGVAPVTERSGNSHWVHWRWSSPTFLRQTFVEWAALPSHVPSGPTPSIDSNGPLASPISPLCARWPTNGSASCIAAGSIGGPTMSRSISARSRIVAHRCSPSCSNKPPH